MYMIVQLPDHLLFLVVLDFNMEYELMKFNLKIENIESAYNDCIRVKSMDSGKY